MTHDSMKRALALGIISLFVSACSPDKPIDPGAAAVKPVTVVSTQGNLLLEYQHKWLELLGEWYTIHGDQVADEQTIFDEQLELSV